MKDRLRSLKGFRRFPIMWCIKRIPTKVDYDQYLCCYSNHCTFLRDFWGFLGGHRFFRISVTSVLPSLNKVVLSWLASLYSVQRFFSKLSLGS